MEVHRRGADMPVQGFLAILKEHVPNLLEALRELLR
jgi:hypothetical protein